MPGKTKGTKPRRSGGSKKQAVSKSKKAQTLFPIGRLNRYLRQGRFGERLGGTAGAFMAAVLEYLTAEILELAGDLCLEDKMKTIKPKHINLGIRSDSELAKLVAHTQIAEGGQLLHIHGDLLRKGKGKPE